jgi:predicted negative regulator of RcsB-dependent stress response
MEFLENNIKGILGIAGLVIVAGLIGTLVSQNSISKEKQVQEKFFAIDAKVKKYKEDKFKAADKTAEKKEEVASVPVDVNQLKTELETFVNENTGTVAAQIAGLELAEIYNSENKGNDALALLQKVETKSDLLSNVLVRMKIAQSFADQDRCSDALIIWNKVLGSKATSYLHAEAKINQALCYKKMNDLAKAEEILNQVKNDKADETGQSNREADRILRLIQFNKSFGT